MGSFKNFSSPFYVQLFSTLFIALSVHRNPFIEGIKGINICIQLAWKFWKKKKKNSRRENHTRERKLEEDEGVFMDLGSHLGNDLEEEKSWGRINAIVGVEIRWWKIKKSVLRGRGGARIQEKSLAEGELSTQSCFHCSWSTR